MSLARIRREPKKRPTMDRGAIGWMINYCYKHFWRMPDDFEIEDLIQEGYSTFYYTVERYPAAIDPPHVMSLFKLVFRSRVEVLAQRKTKTVDTAVGDIALDIAELQHPLDAEMATLFTMVANAPPHILKILELVTTDSGRRKLQASYRHHRDGSRETVNDRLCRLIGYTDPNTDLVESFRNYFRT